MVDVIKDKRKWLVTHTFENTKCPYLFFPANYHGCHLLPMDKDSCTFENCPRLKVGQFTIKLKQG